MSGNRKWEKERAAAAAVQVAFDLGRETQKSIKKLALDDDLTPSEFIRKVLGLAYKAKPVRPRLTLSLSDEDFQALAEAWGIDSEDRLKIKEAAAARLIDFARNSAESRNTE